MKLTRASSYALHVIACIAEAQNRPLSSREMAEAQGISERLLLKVLRPLVDAQILSFVHGPEGGYRLARGAQAISMLAIIEAVDGVLNVEIDSPPHRLKATVDRRLQQVCFAATAQLRKQLSKVNLAVLAKGRRSSKRPSPSFSKRPKKLRPTGRQNGEIGLSKDQILEEANSQVPFDELVRQMVHRGVLSHV